MGGVSMRDLAMGPESSTFLIIATPPFAGAKDGPPIGLPDVTSIHDSNVVLAFRVSVDRRRNLRECLFAEDRDLVLIGIVEDGRLAVGGV